jgi:hypothetical protein
VHLLTNKLQLVCIIPSLLLQHSQVTYIFFSIQFTSAKRCVRVENHETTEESLTKTENSFHPQANKG